MTITKKHRPENPNGFEPYFKNPTSKTNIGVWTIYTTDMIVPKSAVFIPKKLMSLSVDRHRLKRRGLEILRQYSDDHSVLLRLVKKADPDISLDDITSKLETLLNTVKSVDSPTP